MEDIYIIVPTLEPEEEIMLPFIRNLLNEFEHVVVVNDGSSNIHDNFFKKLEKLGCIVLKHHKNFGKGRALKNAINYILSNCDDVSGVVTCDSDGQHSIKDIKKVAKELLENDDALVLGVRDFESDNVPKKSKLGNKITRNIFKVFIGMDITDTQTGLRGMSKHVMELFSDLDGERYEYETKMLIACKELDVKIKEVEIETIYLNNNAASHFNPVKDSIKIYKLFSKHLLLALLTYLLDIILFLIFFNIIDIPSRILASTIIARIISSIFSYGINSKLKFKNLSSSILFKYYVLSVIQMFISGCFIAYLYNLNNNNLIIIKIIVDLIIWFVNFAIQSAFRYKGDKNE